MFTWFNCLEIFSKLSRRFSSSSLVVFTSSEKFIMLRRLCFCTQDSKKLFLDFNTVVSFIDQDEQQMKKKFVKTVKKQKIFCGQETTSEAMVQGSEGSVLEGTTLVAKEDLVVTAILLSS